MAHYTTLPGTYETAVLALQRQGGQLFGGKDEDGPFVLVRGAKITTYWPPNSRRRGHVLELCKKLNYPPEHATTGRITRWLLSEFIQLPHKGTRFDKRWRELAKSGHHWHYTHAIPGRHGYCFEFDLKAAYWQAYLKGESMLWEDGRGYLEDGGALERAKTLIDGLPKGFRVAFLGILASWRTPYLVVDKTDPTGNTIKHGYLHQISYGASFNAAHLAILRIYKLMARLKEIVGDDCVRIHTDSILCKASNGMRWESELFDFLKQHNYPVQVKGQGDCWLLDTNTGVLGRKIIGPPSLVRDAAIAEGVKINLAAPIPVLREDWLLNLEPNVRPDIQMDMPVVEAQTSLPLQIKPMVKLHSTE